MPGSSDCRVHLFEPDLRKGICNADDVLFSNAIGRLWMSDRARDRERAVAVLERVWKLDPSLGVKLPWKALDRDDFRVAVTSYLAQAIRSGMSDESLPDLQKFAARFSKKHPDDDRTGSAVSTIGVTNATSLLPFVLATIRADAGGARGTAISALGDMCSPEATAYLKDIHAAPDTSDQDRRRAALALRQRFESAGLSWCGPTLQSNTPAIRGGV